MQGRVKKCSSIGQQTYSEKAEKQRGAKKEVKALKKQNRSRKSIDRMWLRRIEQNLIEDGEEKTN